MAFCSKCGTELPADVHFCPACGTSAASTGEPVRPAPEPPKPLDPDIADHKALSVLCYIGPFILIPLIGAHESPYVRFHLNNGIWLYISYLICLIVPFVGWGAVVVLFVFNIIGIVKAAQGKFEGLPLLGKFAKFFK